MKDKINQLLAKQQSFFSTNTTKDVDFRIAQLKNLKRLLKENEDLLFDAILKDFSKSPFETYMTELSPTYKELDLTIKNLKQWSHRRRVPTDLPNLPGKSFIIPEPLGNVLVIGAWNYPYNVSLIPAISALAAGNTVVIKPSEIPTSTSGVLAGLINHLFDESYLHVFEGGIEETTELLSQPWGKIFFTGSTKVGRIVYQAAAKNLTPVTLEMGGKSPTFVLKDCNIKITAKRIVWAKFLNAGQTCLAPDYIVVDRIIEDTFLKALHKEIDKYHGVSEEMRENYVQIINTRNFDRLVELIDEDKIYCGGQSDRVKRLIQPTVLKNIDFTDKIMEDEIFGPILPVLAFDDLEEVIEKVKSKPKPLSCYIYSKSSKQVNKILKEVSFGGGAVNDSVMHFSNSYLPFGGVGFSGTGSYHGKAGFDTFTHYKSILHKTFWFEPDLKYPPYTNFKRKLIRWLVG